DCSNNGCDVIIHKSSFIKLFNVLEEPGFPYHCEMVSSELSIDPTNTDREGHVVNYVVLTHVSYENLSQRDLGPRYDCNPSYCHLIEQAGLGVQRQSINILRSLKLSEESHWVYHHDISL